MLTFTEWMSGKKPFSENQQPKIYGMVKAMLPLAQMAANGTITPDAPDDRLRQFNGMVSDAIKHVDELHYDEKAAHYGYELRDALEAVAWGDHDQTAKQYQQACWKLYNLLRSAHFAMTGELA